MRHAPILASVLVVVACGGDSATSAPPQTPATASPPAPPEPAASTAPSDAAPAQTGAQKRPLELQSFCLSPTTIYVGPDPKAGGTGKREVAAQGTLSPIERRADGTQTVWLLDEAGAPLIKVDINSGMRKIEIGKSCRTLDARWK